MESLATKQPSGTPAESHRLGLDAEIPGTDVFGNVQKYLREAIRIIRVATDISEDVGITLFWYRNEPLPTFDYKTAEQISHHQQHTLQTPTGPAPMVTDGVPIDIQGPSRRVPVSEWRAFSPVGPTSSTVPVVFPVLPPNRSLVVLSLHVRLSNGVEFDLGEAIVDDLPTVIQMFGRLTCFGSTKGLKAYRKRSDNNTTQLLGIVRTHAPSDGLAPL